MMIVLSSWIQKTSRKIEEKEDGRERSQSTPKGSGISAIPDAFDKRLHSPRSNTLLLFCHDADQLLKVPPSLKSLDPFGSITTALTRRPLMVSPAAPVRRTALCPNDAPTVMRITLSPASKVAKSEDIV
jgi:hypothetical protein